MPPIQETTRKSPKTVIERGNVAIVISSPLVCNYATSVIRPCLLVDPVVFAVTSLQQLQNFKKRSTGTMRLNIFIVMILVTADYSKAAPGLLIPLYSYPTVNGGAIWNSVRQSAQSNPSVPFVAIVNPNSGPGSSQDSVYNSAVENLITLVIREKRLEDVRLLGGRPGGPGTTTPQLTLWFSPTTDACAAPSTIVALLQKVSSPFLSGLSKLTFLILAYSCVVRYHH
ncbi:hypothetical protein GE061_000351 [Apolygus lucorum]|uniref:Uncharacterized protein n=1 Tax=Apolygus lucorum TaxID=248454 RepID=A0A8S9Y5C8_APOLU|nr:hypothetical protein GE061_000351 [Apolygus lucorum]